MADAQDAVYGLRLRNIPAKAVQRGALSGMSLRPRVEVIVPVDALDRAKEAWSYIVAALPESWRAVDAKGRCAFCKYDVTGVPRGQRCPECGVALDSVAARMAAREGRKPDPDET